MSDPSAQQSPTWFAKCADRIASVIGSGGRTVNLDVPYDCNGPVKVSKLRAMNGNGCLVMAEIVGNHCIRSDQRIDRMTDVEVMSAKIFKAVDVKMD